MDQIESQPTSIWNLNESNGIQIHMSDSLNSNLQESFETQ